MNAINQPVTHTGSPEVLSTNEAARSHQPRFPSQAPAAPVWTAAPVARRFVTINECAEIRPFSPASLRNLRFKAFDRSNSRNETIKGNGTGPAGVWVQIGAKVLLDLDRFDAWVESHRLQGV